MNDETTSGSAPGTDHGGHIPSCGGSDSPLQSRAAFLQNWDWESLVSLNQRTCARGGAQHGANSEAHKACAEEWSGQYKAELSLAEVFHRLRSYHRRAPFLFYNGNTFAYIGREMCLALFADLPALRKRELASAVAHYIAGVLDWEAASALINELWLAASFAAGDRVQTLRGSARGTVVRILEDGRVVFKSDAASAELTSLPESLRKE